MSRRLENYPRSYIEAIAEKRHRNVDWARTAVRESASILAEPLARRERINHPRQEIIDRQADRWGGMVTAIEVNDVVLPDRTKRAIARQAEPERRANVIHAAGEFQAAAKLVPPAAMSEQQPVALQLRFRQTMRDISSQHNTTTFLFVPLDQFTTFLKRFAERAIKEG